MKKGKFLRGVLAVAFAITPLACGSPRTLVKVRNNADNTETTISATTGDGGTTTVNVSPKLVVSADSTKIQVK